MSQECGHTSNSITIAFFSALSYWLGDSVFYPLETISTRLKANKRIHHNPFDFVKQSIKKDGLKLYKGVQLAFPAAFLPTFVYVCVYEWGMKKVKTLIEKYQCKESTQLYFPFFVSSFAEIISMILYLPVDTVRTRVQLNDPTFNYTSLGNSLSEIAKREGFGRFYKSTRLYLICRTLEVAVTFQSFEVIRYFAGPSITWMLINTIVSTALSTTLLNPLEVLITRYALVDTTKQKLNFRLMVQKMRKREGLRGFYKGYTTELIHHCIVSLLWLPVYQIVREKFGVEIRE